MLSGKIFVVCCNLIFVPLPDRDRERDREIGSNNYQINVPLVIY